MTKAELIEAIVATGLFTKAEAKKMTVAKLKEGLAKLEAAKASNAAKKVRKTKPALAVDDPKYNMYFVALPKVIRDRVIKDHLCPRKLYQEYRREGRDHMVQKYGA